MIHRIVSVLIVAAFTILASGQCAEAEPPKTIRLSLAVTENGEYTLTLGAFATKENGATEPSEPSPSDGKLRLGFDDEAAVKTLLDSQNVSFDKQRQCLLMTPQNVEGYNAKRSAFHLPRMAVTPMTLDIDFAEVERKEGVMFSLECQSLNGKAVQISLTTDSFTKGAKLEICEVVRTGKAVVNEITKPTLVTFNKTSRHTFKSDVLAGELFRINVWIRGTNLMAVSAITLQGDLFRSNGIVTEQQGKTVVIKTIDPNSSLAKHGVVAGDQLTSINRFRINSLQQTVTLLRSLKPEDEVTIGVIRNGSPLTITLPKE